MTKALEAARAKAREILADYDAGRPLQVQGDGWLVRMSSALLEERCPICGKLGGHGAGPCPYV